MCTTRVLERRSLFFFSSRRRHTRSKRDWSSDVCSSDLVNGRVESAGRTRTPHADAPSDVIGEGAEPTDARHGRSEERRVGKECRYRWSPERLKMQAAETQYRVSIP